jgi:5-methylcytosine-specific restriction endonuclease McrA
MKIDREFIEKYKTKRGGWTNAQCKALGDTWPPRKGWIERAIKRDHTQADIDNFVLYADRSETVKSRAHERKNRRAAKFADLEAKLKRGKTNPQWSSNQVASDDFLSSFAWRKARMQVLKRDGTRCACCGTSPEHGAVMNVDHIKPRRLFPHLALDLDNLQVLCAECNHGKGNWDQTDWREPQIDPEIREHLKAIMSD